MSGEIKSATITELDAVALLFDEYRQFYQQEADLDLARQFINARIQDNDSVIFVALDTQGHGLGFCQLYPTFSSISACSILVLSDLYVTQHARCVGLGRRLMNCVLEYAYANRITSITLETHKNNQQAQALYESLGFVLDKEFLTYSLDVERVLK